MSNPPTADKYRITNVDESGQIHIIGLEAGVLLMKNLI
jgi:hypothetical protein